MIFENLTWHNITILWPKTTYIPPSKKYTKVILTQYNNVVDSINGIPIIDIVFNIDALNLPPQQEWVAYIVSWVVARNVKRDDLYIVADTVKWPDRRTILWCRWLCKNPFI